jgi:hypothetical protein
LETIVTPACFSAAECGNSICTPSFECCPAPTAAVDFIGVPYNSRYYCRI